LFRCVSFFALATAVTALSAQPTPTALNHEAAYSNSPFRADGSPFAWPSNEPPEFQGGRVSLQHFSHKPDKKAKKAFEKGMNALSDGKEAFAVQCFRDAAAADDKYFDPQLYLGFLYSMSNQPEQALESFEHAMSIDDGSQPAQAGAAWSLFRLGRFAEAEQAGKRASRMERFLPIVHFLVGAAQVGQKKISAETARYFQTAAAGIPDAAQAADWVRSQLALRSTGGGAGGD
jgi:tetratricopeptide (TPR) repeat protein